MNESVAAPIDDEAFIRGTAPMTKQEVRSLVLSKLALKSRDAVVDIGAGTGAVTIEMALKVPGGKVFAIEKNPAAVGLIRQNCRKFRVTNVEILEGEAPGILEKIERVDKIFIGGSGGRLDDILDKAYNLLSPGGRLAATAVTLKTLGAILDFFTGNNILEYDIIHVALARYEKKTGIMRALNPVYILTAIKES